MWTASRRGSRKPVRVFLLFGAVSLMVLIGAACGSGSYSNGSAASSNAASAVTPASTTASASTSTTSAASGTSSSTAQSSETGAYGASSTASPAGSPQPSEANEYGSSTPATPITGGASAAEVKTNHDAKLGTILTDSSGHTLYIFKKDSMNVSNCTGGCAQNWPPLTVTGTPMLAAGVPGTLGTIARSDGTKQVTYNGMPLYHFKADSDPGDTKGQDIGDVWYVVTPSSH